MIVGARSKLEGATLTLAAGGGQPWIESTFQMPRAGRLLGVQINAAGGLGLVEVTDPAVGAPSAVVVPFTAPAAATRTWVQGRAPIQDRVFGPGQLTIRVYPVDSLTLGQSSDGQFLRSTGVRGLGSPHAFAFFDGEPTTTPTDEVAAARALATAEGQLLSAETTDVRFVEAGWHGSALDDRTPAFALIPPTSPLQDLLGSRVLVRPRDGSGRHVVVILQDISDVIEDVSISRRAFLQIAPLYSESLDVTVTPLV